MTKNENLLVIAMEECAEVQQEISKVLRFGANGYHPLSKQTNEHTLIVEYYQLVAVMEMLFDAGAIRDFSVADVALVKQTKKMNVLHYQDVSQEIGTIC